MFRRNAAMILATSLFSVSLDLKTEIYCCICVYSVTVWIVYFPFQRILKSVLLYPILSVQWRLNPPYSKARE